MSNDYLIQQNGGNIFEILSTMEVENQSADLASVWLCYVNAKTVEEINACNL